MFIGKSVKDENLPLAAQETVNWYIAGLKGGACNSDALNGVQGTRDVSGTMPLNLAELHIGSSGVEAAQFNGLIFEVNLITQKCTQGEVNGLTA